MADEPSVFRPSAISYVHIPARDPRRSAAFYEAVFGWRLSGNPDNPHFSDGSGHVIGAWDADREVAGESGVLPHVYVPSVDATLDAIAANGGAVARAPYPEGDLWVATLRDPAGNVIGIWQQGPR